MISDPSIVIVGKNQGEIHMDFETYSRIDVRRADIAIVQGMSFEDIEMRMLAAMGDDEIDSIMLQIDGPVDIEPSPGLLERIMSELPVQVKEERKPGPDYLRHDFTKHQRRYRK